MPISPFSAAINQLADERGLPKDIIIDAVEAAVAAAYRKEYGQPEQNIVAKLDEESGQFKMTQVWDVVEEVENDQYQVLLDQAKELDPQVELEGQVSQELTPHDDFGRIAAQTAKQVISQKLREAEREILYNEYKTKENQLINGYVQQVEGPNVILNIGKLNGLMIASDQIPNQRYFSGQRLKVLVYSVEDTPRGPRVMVTRSSGEFIKRLFELEVPEIATGSVEVKTIAREAGVRTKMAVVATQPGLDPVGSCVGQRGTRVQAVLSEIGEEKIDIIPFDEDAEKMITQALSPARIEKINLNTETRSAIVVVPEDQLPLAIGKSGQNVRLASKLTGWEIDIIKVGETERQKEDKAASAKAETAVEPSPETVTEPATNEAPTE